MNDGSLEKCERFLGEHFINDVDTMMRALIFLQREANEWQGDTPVRNFLCKLIDTGNKKMIEKYISNVAEDTKKAQDDDFYRKFMHDLYTGFNSARDHTPLSEDWLEKMTAYTLSSIEESMQDPGTYAKYFSHITTAMCYIPQESWPGVLESLEQNVFAQVGTITQATKASRALIEKVGSVVAVVGLAAAQLTWEAIKNIYLWYNGEISGEFCAKNIFDSLGSITAGVGGGFGGAALGAGFGPVGAIVGGVAGGIGASSLAAFLMDHLTRRIFDLPKNAALEKAYKHLGVHHSSENSSINSAYRSRALECHPDKPGGSTEKWLELQISFQIIKVDKGEIF